MPLAAHTAATLRWIGAFKLLKAAVLALVAVTLYRLSGKDIGAEVERWERALHLNPTGPVGSALLHKAEGASGGQVEFLVLLAVLYCVVYGIEGVGLIARRRWAEYLTVASTCLLLPVEVYEVSVRATAVRVVVLVLNVLIVVYLVWQLRATRPGSDSRSADPAPVLPPAAGGG